MTKLPRVSGKELLRALERAGFVVHRQRGGHVTLHRPGTTAATAVPIHGNKTLPPGTPRAILRQAQLSVEEITGLL